MATLSGAQDFPVVVRKTAGTPNPLLTAELWVAGVLRSTLLSNTAVTSTSEQTVNIPWDASLLTGGELAGADVELRLAATPGTTEGSAPTFLGAGAGAVSATTGALTVPALPAGVQDQDIAFIQVVVGDLTSTPTVNLPGYFVQWGPDPSISGTLAVRQWMYVKRCDGTEGGVSPGTVTLATNSTTVGLYVRAYVFSGVNPGADWVEAPTTVQNNASDTSEPGPSITTLGANRLAVAFLAHGEAGTATAFAGATGGTWAEAVAEYQSTTGHDATLSCQIASMPTAGTISGGTATMGVAGPGVTRGCALRPVQVPVNTVEFGYLPWAARKIHEAPEPTLPVAQNIVDTAVATGFAAGATNVTLTSTGYAPPDPGGADQTLLVEVAVQDSQSWAEGNVSATYAGTNVPRVAWAASRSVGAPASWSHGVYVLALPSPRAVATSGDVVVTYAGPTEDTCRFRARIVSVKNWDGALSGVQTVGHEGGSSAALPTTAVATADGRIFTAGAFNGQSVEPDPSPTGAGHILLGAAPDDDQCGIISGIVEAATAGSYTPGWSWTGNTHFAGVSFILETAVAVDYAPASLSSTASLAAAAFGQSHVNAPAVAASIAALTGATVGTTHALAPAALSSTGPLDAGAAVVTHALAPASMEGGTELPAGLAGHLHALGPSSQSSTAQLTAGAYQQTHALAPAAVGADASLAAGAYQQTHPLAPADLEGAAEQSTAEATSTSGIGPALVSSAANLEQCIVSVPVVIFAPASAESAAQAAGAVGGTATPPVATDETVYLAPTGAALAAGATDDLDPSGDPSLLEIVGLGVAHADDRLFADGRGYEPRSVLAEVEPDGRGVLLTGRNTAAVGQAERLTYEIESISGLRSLGDIVAVMAVALAPAALTSAGPVQAAALDSPQGYSPASLTAAAQLANGALAQTHGLAPRAMTSAPVLTAGVAGTVHAMAGQAVQHAAELPGTTYSASRNFAPAIVASATDLGAAALTAIIAYQPLSLSSQGAVPAGAVGTEHAMQPREAHSGGELEPALFAGENELFAVPISSPGTLDEPQIGQTHRFLPLSAESAAAASRSTPAQTHAMSPVAVASPANAASPQTGQTHSIAPRDATSPTEANAGAAGQTHALAPAAAASAASTTPPAVATAYTFAPEPMTARGELPAGTLIPSKNFTVASLSSAAQTGAAQPGQTHAMGPLPAASASEAQRGGAGVVWLPTAVLSRADVAGGAATPTHIMSPGAVASAAAAQAAAIGQAHNLVADPMSSAAALLPPGVANPTRRAVGYRTHESRTGYRRRGRTD